METPDWMADAYCKTIPKPMLNAYLMPEKQTPGTLRMAAKICSECQVQAECLAYAMRHRLGAEAPEIIWGGLDFKGRVREAMRR